MSIIWAAAISEQKEVGYETFITALSSRSTRVQTSWIIADSRIRQGVEYTEEESKQQCIQNCRSSPAPTNAAPLAEDKAKNVTTSTASQHLSITTRLLRGRIVVPVSVLSAIVSFSVYSIYQTACVSCGIAPS